MVRLWNRNSSPGTGRGPVRGILLAAALLMLPPMIHAAVDYAVIQSLGVGSLDGDYPENSLLLASDGALYGVTYAGGTNGNGTVFKVNPDGTGFTNLYLFQASLTSPADGWAPQCKLVEGLDGLLYGTTRNGGSGGNRGTVFKLNKDGSSYEVLRNFTSGADAQNPVDGVIQGSDGMLYGTANIGGADGRGAVFKISTNGAVYQVVRSFQNSTNDGQIPYGGVIEAADGFLYGTTTAGGTNGGHGVLFKLSRNGLQYEVLHHFGGDAQDGRQPYASLLEGSDGDLYGTTLFGGTNGFGTIFKLHPDGSGYAVLRQFVGGADDGRGPFAELIEGADGALYGTTRFGGGVGTGVGAVFKMNKDGSGFSVLHGFSSTGSGGDTPYGGLVQDAGGTFYGATRSGGSASVGTVFRLAITAPPEVGPTLTIAPAGTGQAQISWTPATPGFGLQEILSLAPTNWVNSPSGSTNPIVVPATLPMKFYRLHKP